MASVAAKIASVAASVAAWAALTASMAARMASSSRFMALKGSKRDASFSSRNLRSNANIQLASFSFTITCKCHNRVTAHLFTSYSQFVFACQRFFCTFFVRLIFRGVEGCQERAVVGGQAPVGHVEYAGAGGIPFADHAAA